jgi:hypothetical protein
VSDAGPQFRELWMGMVQLSEGLVLSIPVLSNAQCILRQPPTATQTLLELAPPDPARSSR